MLPVFLRGVLKTNFRVQVDQEIFGFKEFSNDRGPGHEPLNVSGYREKSPFPSQQNCCILPQLRSPLKKCFEKLLGVGSEASEGCLECGQ